MTKMEVLQLHRENSDAMKSMTDPPDDGSDVWRIRKECVKDWERLYARSRALSAIHSGHADEVRKALAECGVLEGGEVE